MSTPWETFDVRVVEWLSADPPRIPLLTGGCGSGRTAMLARVQATLGPARCQVIDLSRITSTPEQFARALTDASPFAALPDAAPGAGPAVAYGRALAYLGGAQGAGEPATFLLDEMLDLRVFESFPGLKTVVRDTFACLVESRNRFVLTTRFTSRALRAARELPDRILVQPVPALQVEDVAGALQRTAALDGSAAEEVARIVVALTDGRFGYAQDLVAEIGRRGEAPADPVAALVTLMADGGALAHRCAFSYEWRLNRTRGYGTLRAILAILAEDEPLTLTEIAHELERTPGSTKDYLSWLEEVDLVAMRHKRYAFTDPLLRLWVRLNRGAAPPTEARLAGDVQRYALERLP